MKKLAFAVGALALLATGAQAQDKLVVSTNTNVANVIKHRRHRGQRWHPGFFWRGHIHHRGQ